jgi:tRNA(fMet)-specific endonuclease VapC
MPYLLDTNIISDLIRNPEGAVAQRIAEVGHANVLTSIVVASELRFGAAKKASPKLTGRVDGILKRMNVMPFEAPADIHYANIRTALETRERIISENDLLIAAHAMTLACTLVTANMREFARIDGLACENWIQPQP